MSGPIGKDFQPQFPSRVTQRTDFLEPLKVVPGQRLFNEVTEVYIWYVSSSWYHMEGDSERNMLSRIKRIAEVSMQGGNYLSGQEDVEATTRLKDLFQDLNSGKLRRQDLPQALNEMLTQLTHTNPKAKVVSQATELEYRLCINPPPDQSPEVTEHYRQILLTIIQGITPQLTEINASAIAQGLTQILENFHTMDNFGNAISNAIRHWI